MQVETQQVESVYLRALDIKDLERTYKWHSDPSLYETLGSAYRYVARPSEEEWLRKKTAYSTDQVSLAICLPGNDEHIGNIYLQDIDWVARRAEAHMFIGDSAHRANGYGSSALRQIIAHAFDDLGLQRIYLSVLEDNARAVRAYQRCGFTVEGKLRRHVFKRGEFKDVVVMGICAVDVRPISGENTGQ